MKREKLRAMKRGVALGLGSVGAANDVRMLARQSSCEPDLVDGDADETASPATFGGARRQRRGTLRAL